MRIIADHIKASVFIIGDGIKPSNKEQGSILRILIRKAIIQAKKLEIKNFTPKIAESVFDIYENLYSELKENKNKILKTLKDEEGKFNGILIKSSKIYDKVIKNKKIISAEDTALLYHSHGIPKEVVLELSGSKGIEVEKDYETKLVREIQRH